ncbi:MAG TPA: VWA domain-containing protein [Rhizobiales bacterium]|nr:VWA domain-containing protein [Hyphomicrobiales bacterium]
MLRVNIMSKLESVFGGQPEDHQGTKKSPGRTLRLVKALLQSDKGNVGLIFAGVAIPLIAMAGATVDYSRATKVRSEMMSACDAAALAGMRGRFNPGTDPIQIAKDYFENNLSAQQSGTEPTVEVVDDGFSIQVSATKVIETTTLPLVGITEMPVSVTCKASYGQLKPMEVTFVLDYSGSMGSSAGNGMAKWESQRDAVKQLIHQLTANETYDEVDIALVPFSRYVRARLPGRYIRYQGGNPNRMRTKCFRDRNYPHNLTDETPDGSNGMKWPKYSDSSCNHMRNKKLKVYPLSNDYDYMKNKLERFRPANTTNIQVGLAFGYHVLSSNEPWTEGGAYNDPDKPKVLILVSDGRHNVPGKGPGQHSSVAQAEQNIEELCQNIKDDGVIIFTIAYDIQDNDTRERLRGCSSEPNTADHHPYYFEPYDGQDLFAVFAGIGYQLNPESLRVSQ